MASTSLYCLYFFPYTLTIKRYVNTTQNVWKELQCMYSIRMLALSLSLYMLLLNTVDFHFIPHHVVTVT